MALPNTIATSTFSVPVAKGQSYLGPFKSPGGNYYTFIVAGGDQSLLTAHKATDPEGTWAEQNLGGRRITFAGAIT